MLLTRPVLLLVVAHQDFTTYGEEYKTWPPVFETTKVMWHEYFADIESRVLFPKVGREGTGSGAGAVGVGRA